MNLTEVPHMDNTGQQKKISFRSLLKFRLIPSLEIAESANDNQIAPSPINFKGGGIIFKKYVFNKRYYVGF
jgi:hypothetical protein